MGCITSSEEEPNTIARVIAESKLGGFQENIPVLQVTLIMNALKEAERRKQDAVYVIDVHRVALLTELNKKQ